MAQAVQEMKRVQRSLDRHLAMRAAMRKARIDAIRKADYHDYVPVVARAEHPCSHLCLQCGYLQDEPAELCPSCGKAGLVDLSFESAVDMARDLELKARMKSPSWVKWLLGGALATITVVVGVLFVSSPWPVLAAAVLSIPAFALLLKPVSRLVARSSAFRPVRWHGPIHPTARAGEPSLRAEGRVLALDGLMTGPITGRPCVGYEVAVRLEREDSAAGSPWLLHETRSGSFSVGDVHVESGRGALRLPFRRVEEAEIADAASVATFLRKRGIVSYDGDLELYEACLLEGQQAAVELHAEPDHAVVTLPDDGRGRRRRRGGPYR